MHDDCSDEASNHDFVTHRLGNPQNVKRGRRLQRVPTQAASVGVLGLVGRLVREAPNPILSRHRR